MAAPSAMGEANRHVMRGADDFVLEIAERARAGAAAAAVLERALRLGAPGA